MTSMVATFCLSTLVSRDVAKAERLKTGQGGLDGSDLLVKCDCSLQEADPLEERTRSPRVCISHQGARQLSGFDCTVRSHQHKRAQNVLSSSPLLFGRVDGSVLVRRPEAEVDFVTKALVTKALVPIGVVSCSVWRTRHDEIGLKA